LLAVSQLHSRSLGCDAVVLTEELHKVREEVAIILLYNYCALN
jgi:hypothetical protein